MNALTFTGHLLKVYTQEFKQVGVWIWDGVLCGDLFLTSNDFFLEH